MSKVLVHTRGGVVQGVYSDDPELKVTVFDAEDISETAEEAVANDCYPRDKTAAEVVDELFQQAMTVHPHHVG